MGKQEGLDRRRFITGGVAGVVGAGLLPAGGLLAAEEAPAAAADPKIREYRTLGRTGFKVSDISLGTCFAEAVIKMMLEAGVTYIDTAESYKNQTIIGKAIRGRDRKSVFITSKLELKKEDTVENLTDRFRKCLEELQTDYIDCMMNHMPEELELVRHEAFHAMTARMKADGKLRFVGIAHHGVSWAEDPKNPMELVLGAAAEDGRYDVMLLAYNFLAREAGEKVLRLCAEKNIGTTLMKTDPIGKYYLLKERVDKLVAEGKEVPEFYTKYLERLQKDLENAHTFIKEHNLTNPAEIRTAAIRWALANPHVHAVCCSTRNFEQAAAFMGLSGTRLSRREARQLQAYADGFGRYYCRHACGACEASCPHGVPVNTIMRYHHYYDAHGREKLAMQQYARLTTARADVCTNCEGHCERSCPHGVAIQGLLTLAHQRLTLV